MRTLGRLGNRARAPGPRSQRRCAGMSHPSYVQHRAPPVPNKLTKWARGAGLDRAVVRGRGRGRGQGRGHGDRLGQPWRKEPVVEGGR